MVQEQPRPQQPVNPNQPSDNPDGGEKDNGNNNG